MNTYLDRLIRVGEGKALIVLFPQDFIDNFYVVTDLTNNYRINGQVYDVKIVKGDKDNKKAWKEAKNYTNRCKRYLSGKQIDYYFSGNLFAGWNDDDDECACGMCLKKK
jgi:hypothetical protein